MVGRANFSYAVTLTIFAIHENFTEAFPMVVRSICTGVIRRYYVSGASVCSNCVIVWQN